MTRVIKYQNPNFRNKLKDAREYKRSFKKIPDSKMGIFLARVGLGGLFPKIILGLLLVLALYTIYAPNLLSIKHVEVKNVSEKARESIINSINAYFKTKPFWPQQNLLLLSKGGLSNYLSSKNNKIISVKEIEKDFPSTLIVEIEERVDEFLLQNNNRQFVVSNDGTVIKQLSAEDVASTTSIYSTLLPIILLEEKIFYEQQKLADSDYFISLSDILRFHEEFNYPVVKINIETLERADMEIFTASGFIVKYNLTSDLNKIAGQLKLLLEEIGQARINGVKYIDMRIKDRGYVCYKDAPCAQEFVPLPATSTIETLNN